MFLLITHWFEDYIYYLIAVVVQFLFILFPISVKDWDEDLVQCLMFIAVQTFIASLIFIQIPILANIVSMNFFSKFLVLVVVLLLSVIRLINIIPFEISYIRIIKNEKMPDLDFSEFLTSQRMEYLANLDFESPDHDLRYQAFREKLKTKAPDSSFEDNEFKLEF